MLYEYDVFISFKNLGPDGYPTNDSKLAEDVFSLLTSKGLKVFFSNATLETLGAAAYKKAIDDALDNAQTLIVVGTSKENIESEWVRYEWDGFFSDVLSGHKPDGRLFSYLEGVKPNSLPRSLRGVQAVQHGTGSLDRLYRFVVNGMGTSASSPVPRGQIKQSLAKIRFDIEWNIYLLYSGIWGAAKNDDMRTTERLDRLVDDGKIATDLAHNVRQFLVQSDEIVHDRATEKQIADFDLFNSVSIATEVARISSISSLKYEFSSHGIWHMGSHRPSEVIKFYGWSVIAASCPEFNYDFDLFTETAHRYNDELIEKHGFPGAQKGMIPIITLKIFVKLLEFRVTQLSRLVDAYSSEGHDGYSTANEWKWPIEWGDVGWGGPIVHGAPKDAAHELAKARLALARYKPLV